MTIRITRSGDGYEAELDGPNGAIWTSAGPISPTVVLQELSKRGCHSTDVTDALDAADSEWGHHGASGWADLHLAALIRERAVDGVTPITPGWRFVSIGFENGPTDLGGGVDPWVVTWTSLHGRIVVAHPRYPRQRHDMETYEVAGTDPPVVFAAGEFSNGVWGFYVPDPSSDIHQR